MYAYSDTSKLVLIILNLLSMKFRNFESKILIFYGIDDN